MVTKNRIYVSKKYVSIPCSVRYTKISMFAMFKVVFCVGVKIFTYFNFLHH
jgi:hypothetical protein